MLLIVFNRQVIIGLQKRLKLKIKLLIQFHPLNRNVHKNYKCDG